MAKLFSITETLGACAALIFLAQGLTLDQAAAYVSDPAESRETLASLPDDPLIEKHNTVIVELLGRNADLYDIAFEHAVTSEFSLGAALSYTDQTEDVYDIKTTGASVYATAYSSPRAHRFVVTGGGLVEWVDTRIAISGYDGVPVSSRLVVSRVGQGPTCGFFPNFGIGYEYKGSFATARVTSYAFLTKSYNGGETIVPFVGFAIGKSL